MSMTGNRASLAPTARTKPPSGAARWTWRIALGVVLVLNALCAICWPQVVELIGSYL